MKQDHLITASCVLFCCNIVASFVPRSCYLRPITSRQSLDLSGDLDGIVIPGINDKAPSQMVSEEDTWRELPFPDEIAREQCVGDLVLCERLPEIEKKKSGLFLPGKENPKLLVAKVVSSGPGIIGDDGLMTPNKRIKTGDMVLLKHPWGIGPRDEEYTDETGILRRFSYIRYQDVAAVVSPESEGENTEVSAKSEVTTDATSEPEKEAADATPEPEEEATDAAPEPEEEAADAAPEPDAALESEEIAADATPEPKKEAADATPEPEKEAADATPEPEEEAADATPEPEEEATPEPEKESDEAPQEKAPADNKPQWGAEMGLGS